MKDSDVREMFVKWIKATSWHPCGIEHILRVDQFGEFTDPVQSIYQGYAAGIRKGIKIQKERKQCKQRK